MLSLLAATAVAAHPPLQWASLGLSPIALDLGFFAIKWYSLAYLAGIMLAYFQVGQMIRQPGAPLAQRHVDDLFFYATLGIILGGRLGYALFYEQELLSNPQRLIRLWEGGMSFHGGLIGTVLAIAWVSWRGGLNFVRACDYIAVCVPAGLFFGRCANFVNGELWGRVTDSAVPWVMVFPGAGSLPRHPSQLYEALLEGLVLGLVMLFLFWKSRARWRPGLLVGTFTLGYAAARFMIEYYREPDVQLLDFAMRTGLSMGQWLTLPMMAVGLGFMVHGLARPPLAVTIQPAAA